MILPGLCKVLIVDQLTAVKRVCRPGSRMKQPSGTKLARQTAASSAKAEPLPSVQTAGGCHRVCGGAQFGSGITLVARGRCANPTNVTEFVRI